MSIVRIKNIVFDLDGTLADTAADIISSLSESYKSIPEYKNIYIDKTFIGPPLLEMLENITPQIKELEKKIVIEQYRKIYDNNSFKKTKLYHGVRLLLKILLKKGFNLYLVTNKPIRPTMKIIKVLKIDYFKNIVTPDIIKGEKLDKFQMLKHLITTNKLDRKLTLYVGDSPGDIISSKKNKIKSVGVLNGYSSRKEIIMSKPNYIIGETYMLYYIIKNNFQKRIFV